ncbi:hypothetical protein CEXT_787981 [Caerostris extrusa]|uniref:Uncharacterized protein n=1 Tax=Caerostris extrusa TaxID=172846 RepID=A0AAV4NPH8_CAEEX|nr:hypothetical protein CEXT_787981 [Caerostris extrusa]
MFPNKHSWKYFPPKCKKNGENRYFYPFPPNISLNYVIHLTNTTFCEKYKVFDSTNYNIQYEARHLFFAHKSIRLIRRTQNIWRAEAERAAEINNNILSPRWPKTHPMTPKLFEIFCKILFHREACRLLPSLPNSYHVESLCGEW